VQTAAASVLVLRTGLRN